jgi:hypothetical protein
LRLFLLVIQHLLTVCPSCARYNYARYAPEALRSHEVAFTLCVALYHADDASMGGPSEMIQNVTELADGQRLLFRCANDLAPGMGNNARAARRQKKLVKKMAAPAKGKVDSFKVAVAHRADPGGHAVSMRLPGTKVRSARNPGPPQLAVFIYHRASLFKLRTPDLSGLYLG